MEEVRKNVRFSRLKKYRSMTEFDWMSARTVWLKCETGLSKKFAVVSTPAHVNIKTTKGNNETSSGRR